MKTVVTIAAAFVLALGLSACSGESETPPATPAEDTTPAATPEAEPAATPLATPGAEPGIVPAAAPEVEPEPAPAATPELQPAAAAPETPATPPATDLFAAQDLENTLYMELFCGRVVIRMRPDLAPLHVERIKMLVRSGFYDGLTFHRVISGFMAQGGDPRGDGMGGAPFPDLPAEFTNTPFERGIVGMARAQNPNSANSQFFIMFARTASLDGQYTVWGEVTQGMECVDQIARGQPPANPTIMQTVRVAADVE